MSASAVWSSFDRHDAGGERPRAIKNIGSRGARHERAEVVGNQERIAVRRITERSL